jgi:carboxypeptidase Taq
MTESTQKALERLHEIDRENGLFYNISSIVNWDSEVNLPEDAAQERARQIAALDVVIHGKETNPEIGQRLGEVEGADLEELEADFVRMGRRHYERMVKIPVDLAHELSLARSLSLSAWHSARANNDFASFVPYLERVVTLSREQAAALGADSAEKDSTYNTLLDLYEPGMRAAELDRIFTPLAEGLSRLIRAINEKPAPRADFLQQRFSVKSQDRYCRALMPVLGWNLKEGRLDCSAHPFTDSLGPRDVRITTRFHADDLASGIFSVLHETGHAFYDLNASKALYDFAPGLAHGASMGIHESQSRLLENVIGRSLAFWQSRLPRLRQCFMRQLHGVSVNDFYRAINTVKPSLIRIEADEVTYTLHIILRYELERALMEGDIQVRELPGAWAELMHKYLGLKPSTDSEGVLQDIHWPQGYFGYFPSYALGNLYGLQFWEALQREIPTWEEHIASTDLAPLFAWLNKNIHCWGARKLPTELVKSATGSPLSSEPFMRYIREKYSQIYNLADIK